MAEEAPATEVEGRRYESCGGVVGVGLGLALIVLSLASLLFYGPRPSDASELLASSFALGQLPEGLELEPQAVTLPSGELVVTFSDGAPLELSPLELVTSSKPKSSKPEEEFVEFDWAAVEVLSEGELPSRLYLVRFPRQRAERVLASQFRGLEWRDLSEISARGGSTVVGGGKLPWAGYSADWVRERSFLEGGSFRDTLRVNLSLGQECWIAYSIWPERVAGSEEAVAECLAALEPLAEDDAD